MGKSITNTIVEIVQDIGTLESLLIHASASRRTKAEIQEDLDKMSDIVTEIKKLIV